MTILGLLGASLALAACGSSSSNSGSGTRYDLQQVMANDKAVAVSGPMVAEPLTAYYVGKGLAFSTCVRSHGVPRFPDHGAAVNRAALESALRACRFHLPNLLPPRAKLLAVLRQAARQFAQCMRSHGVPSFPDPSSPGNPGARRATLAARVRLQTSPAFKAAQAACQPIMQRTFSKGAAVAGSP